MTLRRSEANESRNLPLERIEYVGQKRLMFLRLLPRNKEHRSGSDVHAGRDSVPTAPSSEYTWSEWTENIKQRDFNIGVSVTTMPP